MKPESRRGGVDPNALSRRGVRHRSGHSQHVGHVAARLLTVRPAVRVRRSGFDVGGGPGDRSAAGPAMRLAVVGRASGLDQDCRASAGVTWWETRIGHQLPVGSSWMGREAGQLASLLRAGLACGWCRYGALDRRRARRRGRAARQLETWGRCYAGAKKRKGAGCAADSGCAGRVAFQDRANRRTRPAWSAAPAMGGCRPVNGTAAVRRRKHADAGRCGLYPPYWVFVARLLRRPQGRHNPYVAVFTSRTRTLLRPGAVQQPHDNVAVAVFTCRTRSFLLAVLVSARRPNVRYGLYLPR